MDSDGLKQMRLIVGAIVCLLLTVLALGQERGRIESQVFRVIDEATFEQLLQGLANDPSVREQVDAVYAMYRETESQQYAVYREGLEEASRKRAEYEKDKPKGFDSWVREGKDFGTIDANFEYFEQLRRGWQTLAGGVFAALPDDESVIWHERWTDHRRWAALEEINRHRSVIDSYDLIALSEDALREQALAMPAVRDTLEEYRSAVESLVDRWHRKHIELNNAIMKAPGPRRMQEMAKDGEEPQESPRVALGAQKYDLQLSFRDDNIAFTNRLLDLLPEADALALRSAVRDWNAPWFAIDGPAEHVFRWLLAEGVLAPADRDRVLVLYGEFQEDSWALYEQVHAAHVETALGFNDPEWVAHMNEHRDDVPGVPLVAKRRALHAQWLQRLQPVVDSLHVQTAAAETSLAFWLDTLDLVPLTDPLDEQVQ